MTLGKWPRCRGAAFAMAMLASLSACPQSPCFEVEGPTTAGTVTEPFLNEISGVAASALNEGVLWVHNDSGDKPRAYALRADGAIWAIANIPGAQARDWEDIAIGPGPETGTPYLYLGDIGDNESVRPAITIYRVKEPDLSGVADRSVVETDAAERFDLTYPGAPATVYDCEALFVDPRDGAVYLITKDRYNRDGGVVKVFTAGQLESGNEMTELVEVASFTLPANHVHQITGADMAPNARGILVRSYGALRYWRVREGQSIGDAFGAAACDMPFALEPQGESVAWTADSGGYLTISEAPGGRPQPIHAFRIGEPIAEAGE